MKCSILTILAVMSLMMVLFADEGKNIYPLDFTMRLYPEEIRYGDPCFITFSVTNQGSEPLYLPYRGKNLLNDYAFIRLSLDRGQKTFLSFAHFDMREGVFDQPSVVLSFPGCPVKPGETIEFHNRMVWLPLPEFARDEGAKELLKVVNVGEGDFILRSEMPYNNIFRSTVRVQWDEKFRRWSEFPSDALNARELDAKGYALPRMVNLECSVRILPRPAEELKLLQNWYLELPTTASGSGEWTHQYVFAHPFHVRGSPYKMAAPTPEELGRKREPFESAYRRFISSMATQTWASSARIKRTDTLAAKILERAKQPDSTISQNMVEFIQLRGFLVDMRYAESPEAEKVAKDKLMDFVEQSHYKELWLPFLEEVGFPSIVNDPHFPYAEYKPTPQVVWLAVFGGCLGAICVATVLAKRLYRRRSNGSPPSLALEC